MRKYILLMLLLVFVAGCVGRQVKIEANNGLKFTEFFADPRVAEFSDNILFAIGVENVGGTTARNVELKLFGLENIWRHLSRDAPAAAADVTHDFNKENFDPPVPVQNRPGDLKIFTRTFRPPILPEGVEQDFPVTARVAFDYSTTGSIIVPTISKSLLKIRTDKGEAVDSVPRVTNSNGPLKIGLSRGTVPIVIDDTRTGEQEVTFVIEFVNVGDGFPITEVTGQAAARTLGLLQGSIALFGSGVRFDDKEGCLDIKPDAATPTKIDFTSANIDLLKLRSNGRLPLGCTVKIQRNAFTPITSGIITFSINMNYRYFVEKTIDIKVLGTGEAAQPLARATPTPTIVVAEIPLATGWNFISLPATPSDKKVETITSAIKNKVESIWHYEGATGWFIYAANVASNLLTLEPGKGYAIKMKEAATLEISGTPFEFQPINLAANKDYMIGAPYTDTKLSSVIGTCDLGKLSLSSIDTNNNKIPITVNPDTLLSSGKGYWIKSTDACTLQK